MRRKAHIIGHATDYAGTEWDVRERGPTAHGFDVLIGWPRDEPRGRGGWGVATIQTAELARYLQATRLRDVDLPILAHRAWATSSGSPRCQTIKITDTK